MPPSRAGHIPFHAAARQREWENVSSNPGKNHTAASVSGYRIEQPCIYATCATRSDREKPKRIGRKSIQSRKERAGGRPRYGPISFSRLLLKTDNRSVCHRIIPKSLKRTASSEAAFPAGMEPTGVERHGR